MAVGLDEKAYKNCLGSLGCNFKHSSNFYSIQEIQESVSLDSDLRKKMYLNPLSSNDFSFREIFFSQEERTPGENVTRIMKTAKVGREVGRRNVRLVQGVRISLSQRIFRLLSLGPPISCKKLIFFFASRMAGHWSSCGQ